MKRLHRANVPAPVCLACYQHGIHSWGHVTPVHKQDIRNSLRNLQGEVCAYCEGPLDQLGQHIEHFRRKSLHPTLTFSWGNLYWSCDKQDSCGRYKDHGAGAYSPADLVDPCVDDPDLFFRFRSNGSIGIRVGLSSQDTHRAEETLRVFCLDPEYGRLRRMRQAAVAGYVGLVDGGHGFTAADLAELFESELLAIQGKPFSTAIRHVLTEP